MTAWRIVLISVSSAAVSSLSTVLGEAGHTIDAVISLNQDTLVGAVAAAVPAKVDLLLPATRTSLARMITARDVDLLVCLGFPWKIPAAALGAPRLGSLNIHPSLLPRHRGPYPISHALFNSDEQIGVTAHRMDDEFDAGPILAQRAMPLGDGSTFERIEKGLQQLSFDVLLEALQRVGQGERGTAQHHADATYAGAPGAEYCTFEWMQRRAADVHNLVLGWRFAQPAAAPVAHLQGRPAIIRRTQLLPDAAAVRVECADGPIWVLEAEPVA